MAYAQKQALKFDRFIESLTSETEFFGFIGRGYPNSLYKVYVRAPGKTLKWWRFEIGGSPSNVKDPIEDHADLPVARRVTAVWGPLPDLRHFDHHPEKTAIGKLIARAKQLPTTA